MLDEFQCCGNCFYFRHCLPMRRRNVRGVEYETANEQRKNPTREHIDSLKVIVHPNDKLIDFRLAVAFARRSPGGNDE